MPLMPVDETFADIVAANATFAESFPLAALDVMPSRRLGVLTCMDTRIDPLRILGLEPGEAAILRNGGARVDDGVIATLVLAQHLLGVDRLAVLAHTNCRMTASSPAEIHARIRDAGGPDTSAIAYPTTPDPALGVREDLERLRTSALIRGLAVGGFVYDVETGRITQIG